jgi:sec-independent protein translocase protein TatA
MGLGTPEILLILLIVIVIFGAKKLPELGRSLGSGLREFKKGITGEGDKDDKSLPKDSPQPDEKDT